MASIAIDKALKITADIQNGNIQPDIATITALVSKQSTGTESQLLNIASTALLICWIIGIIDSYRAGHTQEKYSEMPAE